MRNAHFDVHGENHVLLYTRTITGCGARFDGRIKFTIRRESDGSVFEWLGSRTSKSVPFNARLTDHVHAYPTGSYCRCGHQRKPAEGTVNGL